VYDYNRKTRIELGFCREIKDKYKEKGKAYLKYKMLRITRIYEEYKKIINKINLLIKTHIRNIFLKN